MNFEKYKDNGLSGLRNLGNTCFLNSTMQVLSHTYELNLFLDSKTHNRNLNSKYGSALLIAWDSLREKLWQKQGVVSPFKFVKTVHTIAKLKGLDTFTGFNQNDLPEFLIFVIDCFHSALSRNVKMTIEGVVKNDDDIVAVKCFETIKKMYENDYSEIWKLFYGIHVSIIETLDQSKIISVIPEPYFILNLPIPEDNKYPTLEDCFELYTTGEIMNGDNKIKLEETGEKIEAKKSIKFWSLPDILVIDIKRFNIMNKKNQILVDFTIDNLNLSKYVIGYNKHSFVYDLYGVCNHSGSVMGGHYTAFVKNANGKWYHYNDTIVTEVKIIEQIKSKKAYCFFYRKRTNKL